MNGCKPQCSNQDHVHELQGSVKITGPNCALLHNHRFAVVTGEAIQVSPNNHYHKVSFKTDSTIEHEHEFCGNTSGAFIVGDRHVHFLEGCTTVEKAHKHEFRAATLIDDPIGD